LLTVLPRGLGIGTAPAALTAHGIKTTTVEIDPVVVDFATKYFSLPTNQTFIIEDAVSYVALQNTLSSPTTYDYIIHDVFTGGAEPIDLFTPSFIRGLRGLLKQNGAIAIVGSPIPLHLLTI
jgi:spermidine synthase